MDYMTKEEAEKRVADMNVPTRMINQFCPLIKEDCLTSCVCWAKANVRKNTAVKSEACYYVQEGYCNNGMFN